MANGTINDVKEPNPPQESLSGNPKPKFDWPPPVHVATMIATALAAGLLLAGYEEAALVLLLVSLILQGVHIVQLRAFRDEYVRQHRENAVRT